MRSLSCRVETAVNRTDEYYLSLMIDPVHYGVRVTLLPGGWRRCRAGSTHSGVSASDGATSTRRAIVAAIRDLASEESNDRQAAIVDVGEKLTRLFLTRELMLAEVNPLFFDQCGLPSW